MSWILDVIFVLAIVGGILIGVRRGFIAEICKLAGTVFSIFVAITFCNAFQVTLEKWFGMTSALVNAIGNETAGYWIAVVISFVILIIFVRLAAWAVGKLGTALVGKIKAFDVVNQLFGGLLGLLKTAIACFLILAFFKNLIGWANLTAFENFINSSTIVGAIFKWDWFIQASTFSFLGFKI
ncbi:MAG: CvpA family protein [Clostridia bacterium]|nr:CvpA family protein [Clostridia bacterium]